MEKGSYEITKNVGGLFKKKGSSYYYFWVVDEVKNSHSLHTDQQILDHFLRDYRVAHRGHEYFVECFPCKPNDQACHIAKLFYDKEPTFFFVDDILFSTLGIRLPFSLFEVECLDFIAVAPTHLHPNSWAFIRAFEALMEFLGAASSIGILFFLLQVKDVEKENGFP